MNEKPESEKITHAAAGYEFPSSHAGERCSGCMHFISAVPPRCEGVESPIQRDAWCRRYEDTNALVQIGF